MHQQHYQQGLNQWEAGDRIAALQAFDRALRINPHFVEAYAKRGRLRFEQGDRPGAISDYTQALQLQPSSTSYLGRALVHLATGEARLAILDAEQSLVLNPDMAAAHNLLGTAYQKLGNPERAIDAYKQATQQYVNQKDKANAQRCLEVIGQLQALLQTQRQVIARTNLVTSARPMVQPEEFFQQAIQKLNQGNYRGALADFDWIIQTDPKDAKAYCQRAITRSKLSDPKGALADLAMAMQLSPQDRQVQLQRGMVRLELGDALGAIADFTHLLQFNAEDAEIYVQRGNAYGQVQNYRQAIEDYSRALSLKLDDAEIYQHRAAARAAFDDPSGAIEDYQKATNLYLNQGNWDCYQETLAIVKQLQVEHPFPKAKTTPPPTPEPEPTQELYNQLLRMVGGNLAIAQRLIDLARHSYPDMTEEWYLKKVIFDLENDRLDP